jgi:hypothetical protein
MPTMLRYPTDAPDAGKIYATVGGATRAFEATMRSLERFGQSVEASLHIADHDGEFHDYPDYVLTRGPRGGVRKEKA